jgi:UDP-2,3-diacylglucosamine pyrophosphatase LpxH
MLVVISDMHLADGTAGDHNLKPKVFQDFVDQLAIAHAKVREYNPQSRVEIVYAGNIFDMRRTHFWHQQPEHKPWRHFQVVEGDAHAKPPASTQYLEGAVQLFNQIMIHPNVSPIKSILGDKLADRFGGIEPLRLYIPGDADRLINLHPAIRARVIDFLGLDLGRSGPWDPNSPFFSYWVDHDHGALIRHGHEWDTYSFEGDPSKPEDYYNIPMSDLINTELFARLTYHASLLQPAPGSNPQVIETFRSKLEQIDNVRPVSSVVKWLARHFIGEEKKLLQACIENAVTNFESQPYVKWWLSSAGHDKWYNPLDEADRLEFLIAGLKRLWVGKTDAALAIFDKFSNYDPYERYVEMAAKEPHVLQEGSRIHFVVYGHTHKAQHVPIGMVGEESNRRLLHYINTGSLRPTHTVARDGSSFHVTESLDYAIFYRPDERPGASGPTFELHSAERTRI